MTSRLLDPTVTKIIWGNYVISDMFSVLEFPEPPTTSTHAVDLELMPDKKYRPINSPESMKQMQITVNRQVDVDDNFKLLNQLTDEGVEYVFRITDQNGVVLAEFNRARLRTKVTIGASAVGKGNDVVLTWSVGNEEQKK